MSDPLLEFRRDSLVPDNARGGGQVFQLTQASVSPTIVVGRDRWGMPVEATLPHNNGKLWVHPCGAINNVPMATAPTGWREPEQERYRQQITLDLLRNGWIPLDECPYTQAYREYTRSPCLVDNPSKIEDCGGGKDGKPCSHLGEVMKGRAERFAERHAAEQAHFQTMKAADVAQMMTTLVEGIRNADQPTPKAALAAAKQRLADGKGE
jgi:hypothetical protein